MPTTGIDCRPAIEAIQQNIGGCREELGAEANFDKCWKPAEFVLWGKLVPAEGLGPRCYDCARKHVPGPALRSRSEWALVNVSDLAYDITAALQKSEEGEHGV